MSPGQTLYDVLPPGGRSATTTPGSPTSGDPGNQPLVAPANAPNLSPDPNLSNGPVPTGGDGATAPKSASSGGSAAGVGPEAGPDDLLVPGGRLARILELTMRPAAGNPPPASASAADFEAVTRLLGRSPAGEFRVVVRADNEMPAVIENAPFLFDGTPMPTRYWLVDPGLRAAVSRLESAGGVRQAEADLPAGQVAEAHARYARERDALIGSGHRGPVPVGGVGGTRQGVKCLHAHLAWWLTGADDPVGEWTAHRIGLRPSAVLGRH